MSTGITYNSDKEYLESYDLTLFPNAFQKVSKFIIKNLKFVIGTRKELDLEIIRMIELEENKKFAMKIIFSKSALEDNPTIESYIKDTNGINVVEWNNTYSSINDLQSDLDSISSNIGKIKE